ncbi:hypothetical protein [Granulicella tundricola]|uniref:MCM family protein n=1 Tax=Granulicella tundricola (strain ATCC BAA-1859 / DSM 23138 / MP5ACTX9) TaxID=1198114 RepID=E8WXH1_GRATM|nr:hypothetical protein [Granulicella tundricola]ADW67504.1 MCM family protein [Granulicella tundricola MP5ACTX9]
MSMVESEREMVRKTAEKPAEESFTSLQPTYEDSVPPDPENDWEYED